MDARQSSCIQAQNVSPFIRSASDGQAKVNTTMAHAHKYGRLLCFVLLLLGVRPWAEGQRVRGELRMEVRDAQGAAVAAKAELVSEANQFLRNFELAGDGRYVAQGLPFGLYRLRVTAQGFAPWSGGVEVRSEVPVHVVVALGVAPVSTQVEVNDNWTLLDPSRTGN